MGGFNLLYISRDLVFKCHWFSKESVLGGSWTQVCISDKQQLFPLDHSPPGYDLLWGWWWSEVLMDCTSHMTWLGFQNYIRSPRRPPLAGIETWSPEVITAALTDTRKLPFWHSVMMWLEFIIDITIQYNDIVSKMSLGFQGERSWQDLKW